MSGKENRIGNQNVQDILSLIPMQQGMLFHYLQESETNLYTEQLCLHLSGTVSLDLMRKAWEVVMDTNEMLRTVFRWEKLQKPVQIILKQADAPISIYDLAHCDPLEKEERIQEIKQWDQNEKIDIRTAPFQISLILLDQNECIMLITNHHILYDGWSNGIILKEFVAAYDALAKGLPPEKQVKSSFKEFIKWLHSQNPEAQKAYWMNYLEGFDTVTKLPRSTPRKEVYAAGIEQYTFTVEKEAAERIHRLQREERVTTAAIFYTIWGMILQKYTNTDDIIFGTTVSGRNAKIPDIETMVGLFINTIPLRVHASPEQSIVQLIKEIDQVLKERMEYENIPLLDVKSCSNIDPQEELFDSIMVIENYPLDKQLNHVTNLLQLQSYSIAESTNYDLTLVLELHDQLKLRFIYNTATMQAPFVQQIAEHFSNALTFALAHPTAAISAVEMISDEERERLLTQFNQTAADYPKDATLHAIFEARAAKAPDRIAVVDNEQALTYRELNEKANRLARRLREKGVGPERIVGVLAERSFEMLVGIYGILKAGGAYLPISPDYPEERVRYLLEDSEAHILLTQTEYRGMITFAGEILDLAEEMNCPVESTDLQPLSTPRNAAYIIYTSGSTGKPKGVVVEHRSVVNILTNLQNDYPLRIGDTYLLKTTFTFDVSVTEIFGWFMGDGRLAILPPGGEKDVQTIVDTIATQKITHLNFVPSMLQIFLDGLEAQDTAKLSSLRFMFVAGEAFPRELVRRCTAKLPVCTVENIYGPTEATIYVTRYSTAELGEETIVPIGKPLNNVRAYIIGKDRELLPIGVAGELCVSGDCLARGYFRRPELTEEKFIDHPSIPGEKMYRTGDLTRWLADGNIEYLGRIDHQVKIRGFRIELGEIEARILRYEPVKEAAVIDRDDPDGGKYLCAYFVATREVTVGEVREFLLKSLPEYMVPSYFLRLEQMPLNSNGKIDRKALPAPGAEIVTGVPYVAPRDETEEALARIWAEVLGVEKVGIEDNFFELGGHSLKATILMGRIQKELNLAVSLTNILKMPTIKKLSGYIQTAAAADYETIEQVEDRAYYEASSAQKRVYMLQQFDLQSTVYNMTGVMEVTGVLDRGKVERVFQQLIRRHETLRTSFDTKDGQIIQIVHEHAECTVTGLAKTAAALEEMVRGFVRPFDLKTAPLFRIGWIEAAPDRHYLVLDMHHIISDGISMGILIQEFGALYQGRELPPLTIQYRDYAERQNRLLHSEQMKEQEAYWLQRFADEIPLLNLPTDFPRPTIRQHEGESIYTSIDAPLTRDLRKIALDTGSTLYMVLLSGINILLAKYSGQEDIVVGSPLGGRPHTELHHLIGMFVNTLAMRNQPLRANTYSEFLHHVKENALEAYEHQDYQFEELVDTLQIRRDMGRNPLFDVMFALETPGLGADDLGDLVIRRYPYANQTAKFDLTIAATEQNDQIILQFEYGTRLFREKTVRQMAQHLQNILRIVTQNPQMMLREIDFLSPEEKETLIHRFNDTKIEYPHEKTIQDLFAEQVKAEPEKTALVVQGRALTYSELDDRANSLAHHLRARGVGEDIIVGIMAESSPELIIGVLAIVKAGGAYLPIDPGYPDDRIEYLLADGAVEILLTRGNPERQIPFTGSTIDLLDAALYSAGMPPIENVNTPHSLAYVIYTSGSTGKPKGVMIEHRNVIRLVKEPNFITFRPDDVILQTGTLSFDASTFEIWGALLNGLELHLGAKNLILSSREMEEYIDAHQITVMWLTAPLFNLIADERPKLFAPLRCLLVGGDVLSPKHINKVKQHCPAVRLINGYGPTENTTFSTCFPIDHRYTSNIPIGRPIQNSSAYILDADEHLCPIGVIGELCVGGDGLARGYLHQPQLTAERFVENPVISGERIYRTGDLARWLGDGTIEFYGRKDHQVKIRGFRVELGEIETSMLELAEVKEAAVVVRRDQDGNKYLCAYYVTDHAVTPDELREKLADHLPGYMLPSICVPLHAMPLNRNGKIDRQALPEPAGQLLDGRNYVAPGNAIEETLVTIWTELLGIENIGIEDHFFEIGGHSLRATILAGQIQKELGVEIPLSVIFQQPTIRALGGYILQMTQTAYQTIAKAEEKEYYRTSSAQKRMYMLQQFDVQGTSYNIPNILAIEGKLDRKKVEAVLQMIIQRHETLRTSFLTRDNQLVQKVNPTVEFVMEYTEDSKTPIAELVSSFVRPFDLSKAPLLRVGLVQRSEERHILMIDMHHIVSDGTSMGILVKEFAALYENRELPDLPLQYRDYAEWQNNLLTSEIMQRQESYWLRRFQGDLPVLSIPTDYPRPEAQSFAGATLAFAIPQELTSSLRQFARESGSTMYMVLLSVISILLSKYSGQEDLIVGTPIAGRQLADLHPIIGVFVNTLAMRNQPKGEKTFAEFVREVRENTLQAFQHQDYQFEELVEHLQLKRDFSRNPLFDVMFSMQNMDTGELKIGDARIQKIPHESHLTKFDLTFTAEESGDQIMMSVEFCTSLFQQATIEGMAQCLYDIISTVTADPEIVLQDILMGGEGEVRLIGNKTAAPLPVPTEGHSRRGAAYLPPTNRTEEKLAAIWSEILGVAEVGIEGHFFELGGQSSTAALLSGQIRKEFAVDIPLSRIFTTPTIRGIAHYIRGMQKAGYRTIPLAGPQDYYEVSSAQKRVYLVQQLDLRSTGYNMPMVLEIEGNLDVERVETVFAALIQRHETLRTFFELVDDRIVQRIQTDVAFHVRFIRESERSIDELVREFVQPFDLQTAPLLRVTLIQRGPLRHILMLDMHHIISDGTSVGILIHEFTQLYHDRALSELRIQYKDFSEWQNHLLRSKEIAHHESYWLNRFSDELPVLSLPTDFSRTALQRYAGEVVSLDVTPEMAGSLYELCQQTDATLYMVLLSVTNILLAKYSGQEDLIVGSPIAGRSHADLQQIIGMFVNTLAMRNQPAGEKTYRAFLEEVKENALQAFEHQDYQFEELVEKLQLKKGSDELGRNPLFDVMFSVQNMDMGKLEIAGLTFTPCRFRTDHTKFDLRIFVTESDPVEPVKKTGIHFEYRVNLFKRETIERMAVHFGNIITAITQNPSIPISEIDMLTAKERELILLQFNATDAPFPEDKILPQIFEEQAERIPDAVAISYEGVNLTYRALNSMANRLARTLREKGVGRDRLVGMVVDRSCEMMIGILGIIKAGGAYLPISADYPEDRIRFILDDGQAPIVLTQTRHCAKLVHAGVSVLNLDEPDLYAPDGENPAWINRPTDLAYAIYTSGSTGKPKGVAIEHRSLINTITHLQSHYPLGEKDTLLQSTVYTFDASVREIFWWFFAGARLCLLPHDGEKNPREIVETIACEQVTAAKFVPVLLNEIFAVLAEMGVHYLQSLRYLFVGGEALTRELVGQYFKLCTEAAATGRPRLVNVYGPSETAIHCTEYEVTAPIESLYAPIGTPISNDQVYILDRYGKPVALGVAGELYVAGVGVGREYLNNRALTEERFVQNPLIPLTKGKAGGHRAYRTGDLARWLPGGLIEFLGRIDQQVKIRGYRIEPGEIESQLLRHPAVKEAVVIDREDQGGKYLCAYIVTAEELPARELREHLKRELPDYMVPSHFVYLEKLPLNRSGKIDRKALPLPEGALPAGVEYVAPENELEAALAEIWKELLQLDKIGVMDNFFEIGGHSLKAMILTAKIHKQLNVKVPVGEIFKYPTIKELAQYIAVTDEDEFVSLQKQVTPQQLLAFWSRELDGFTYTALPIRKVLTPEQVEIKELKKTLNTELTQHFEEFCHRHKTGKSAVLFAIFNLILMKTLNLSDLTLGIQIAGESRGASNPQGRFFNDLPVRTRIDSTVRFSEFLRRVNEHLAAILDYRDYPFADLHTDFHSVRGLKNPSPFSILFTDLPYSGDGESGISPHPAYGLTLYVREEGDTLSLCVRYENCLEEAMIENILASFPHVMDLLLENDLLLQQVTLAGTADTHQFAQEFDIEFDDDLAF